MLGTVGNVVLICGFLQITGTFVLDKTMRERIAALNPTASTRPTNRLIEAQERNYWIPITIRWKLCALPAKNWKTGWRALNAPHSLV